MCFISNKALYEDRAMHLVCMNRDISVFTHFQLLVTQFASFQRIHFWECDLIIEGIFAHDFEYFSTYCSFGEQNHEIPIASSINDVSTCQI